MMLDKNDKERTQFLSDCHLSGKYMHNEDAEPNKKLTRDTAILNELAQN